jgi:RNA polymerase sigma-70 factor (ECF subfamily)
LGQFIAARRRLEAADADDIAQEVFLRVLRYDREALITDPRGYLFRIAQNVASEWSMRARQRRPHDSSRLDELADDTDIAGKLETAERDSELQGALQGLRPRAREVLRLHFGEGLTYEGIAAQLGVSRRIVKRDIVDAYASLRVALSTPGTQPADSPVPVALALGKNR